LKIHVLHILPSLNLYGGTPRKVHDLIEASPRHQAIYCWARWEDALLRSTFDNVFERSGIACFSGDYGKNVLKHAWYLVQLIDAYDVRVVHGYFESGFLLATAVKLFRHNLRTVVSFVGLPAPIGFLRRRLMKLLSSRLDQVVYVSRFVQGSFEASHPFLSKRPAMVIYNGVKPRSNREQVARIVQQPLRLISVSGLAPVKNLNVLLEAVAILRSKREELLLVIVGDGPLKESLRERAKQLGVQEVVDFVGYQDDVGSYLAESHIYVHPCRQEGFGLSIVEAMLQRLPVIAARAGALPELVEDEVSGILVDPDDSQAWASAIERLARDVGLAAELAARGQVRAREKFNFHRFVAEHQALYERLGAIT